MITAFNKYIYESGYYIRCSGVVSPGWRITSSAMRNYERVREMAPTGSAKKNF